MKRLTQLFIGLILYALGIYFTLQANLGVAPWDAFHQGLAQKFGITFGQASIVVGVVIVIFNMFFKENIGIGTIANTVIIGLIIDLFYKIDLVPEMTHFLSGLFIIILGMVIIALATYFYIGAAYGAGPRDGLMIIMVKVTQKPVGLVRLSLESTVLLAGILLGGKIGVGTIIIALGIGPIVQLVFKILKFEIEKVEHQYLFSQS